MLWDLRACVMISSCIGIAIFILVDAAPNPVRVYSGRVMSVLSVVYIVVLGYIFYADLG